MTKVFRANPASFQAFGLGGLPDYDEQKLIPEKYVYGRTDDTQMMHTRGESRSRDLGANPRL